MIFREACRADLPAIIALLADDVLGKARDFTAVDAAYEKAFADLTSSRRLKPGDSNGRMLRSLVR